MATLLAMELDQYLNETDGAVQAMPEKIQPVLRDGIPGLTKAIELATELASLLGPDTIRVQLADEVVADGNVVFVSAGTGDLEELLVHGFNEHPDHPDYLLIESMGLVTAFGGERVDYAPAIRNTLNDAGHRVEVNLNAAHAGSLTMEKVASDLQDKWEIDVATSVPPDRPFLAVISYRLTWT